MAQTAGSRHSYVPCGRWRKGQGSQTIFTQLQALSTYTWPLGHRSGRCSDTDWSRMSTSGDCLIARPGTVRAVRDGVPLPGVSPAQVVAQLTRRVFGPLHLDLARVVLDYHGIAARPPAQSLRSLPATG